MPDNSSAHVEEIAILEEMRAALLRFQSEANEAVTNAQREIVAAIDGLQERLRYWQRQLRMRQETLAQAKNELNSCLNWRGPHGERADCSAQMAAVRQAERKLQEAQEAIRTAQIHIKRVEEANANFQSQAHRLNTMLTSNELPKASAFLSKCLSIVQSYIKTVAKGAAVFGISAIIAVAGGVSSDNVRTENPVSSEPTVIKLIQDAKAGDLVHAIYDAGEKKKENQDEIEKSLQEGHWLQAGIAHSQAGRYAEALDAFDRAIQLNPAYAQAYAYKGDALTHLKRYDEAQIAYDRALELKPSNAAN
jgi:tetratricopeptide (TPR) repeat protein